MFISPFLHPRDAFNFSKLWSHSKLPSNIPLTSGKCAFLSAQVVSINPNSTVYQPCALGQAVAFAKACSSHLESGNTHVSSFSHLEKGLENICYPRFKNLSPGDIGFLQEK